MLLKLVLTPKPGPALRALNVDLDDLAEAMSRQEGHGTAWLDPVTGDIESRQHRRPDEEDTEGAPPRILIEPVSTRTRWGDISDFVEDLPEGELRTALEESIHGRGVFRRFRDTLRDHPDAEQAWLDFSNQRQRERAVSWLADQGFRAS